MPINTDKTASQARNIWTTTWQNQQNECAPSEDSDQPGHPSSRISLRCVLNGKLRTQGFFMRTAKTDQIGRRLGGCPGWSESSLGTQSLYWFCHVAAHLLFGPRQANFVLIAYASSEGSGEPAHPRSLARTAAACSYKQLVKRNLQIESQILGPSECLGMRS